MLQLIYYATTCEANVCMCIELTCMCQIFIFISNKWGVFQVSDLIVCVSNEKPGYGTRRTKRAKDTHWKKLMTCVESILLQSISTVPGSTGTVQYSTYCTYCAVTVPPVSLSR